MMLRVERCYNFHQVNLRTNELWREERVENSFGEILKGLSENSVPGINDYNGS